MVSREEKARRKTAARAEEGRRRELAGSSDCYCGPDDDYCATCQVCGRPGHLRHFPGAAPYTGSWCGFHYWRLKLLHPSGAIGCWIWLAAVIVGLNLLVRTVF